MSCYDGVFGDKIDQSISAKQSEQLVIICALCDSVYQKSKIKCDTCKVNLRASQTSSPKGNDRSPESPR